jgi:hypothetical protein
MDWAIPVDLTKPTQSNPKNWVRSGIWVDIDFKNEKSIKNWVSGKIEPNSKNPTTQ